MNSDTGSEREQVIIRTSIIGILANLVLAGFKAVVGILSHSIAITMDAVNNLSDAASSVITIIGTKLASKEPDKKHPFGYGRIEYLSAMVIALLVLYAGITALTESVKKILSPELPEYTPASLIIVAVAVAVKLILGSYVKRTGLRVHSDSLKNSGEDAALDAVISASTLAAAGIYLYFGLSLEAWLGALISLLIIKSGLEMLKDTLSQILGERADISLARAIKETVLGFSPVSGVYDLVLHNYGPDAFNGSLHIEVPDTLSADDLDKLLRQISLKVYEQHNVILTAIGVYSVNTQNPKAVEARKKVGGIVLGEEHVLQMHGFYLDEAEKSLRFDVVISFDAPDRHQTFARVCELVQQAYPEYTLQVSMDTDFSET